MIINVHHAQALRGSLSAPPATPSRNAHFFFPLATVVADVPRLLGSGAHRLLDRSGAFLGVRAHYQAKRSLLFSVFIGCASVVHRMWPMTHACYAETHTGCRAKVYASGGLGLTSGGGRRRVDLVST